MAQVNDERDNEFDVENPNENEQVVAYLMQKSSTFADLRKVRVEIAKDPKAEEFYKNQRTFSDNADSKKKKFFGKIMQGVSEKMNKETQFLTDIENQNEKSVDQGRKSKVLDLGMAPGGFCNEVRKCLSSVEVHGITLSIDDGGYRLHLEKRKLSRKPVNEHYLDVTMFAAEMGVNEADIPSDHPDKNSFNYERLFTDQMFDLTFCDCQVLRTHKFENYRGKTEALRLKASQLIFSLQNIKTGGTFVMLLHRVEEWPVLKIIYAFTKFSSQVMLFKDKTRLTRRSSFYLVAKGVKPQEPAALSVIEEWKEIWKSATFDYSTWDLPKPTEDEVKSVLADFGDKLIEMFEPLWLIQSNALKKLRDEEYVVRRQN